MNSVERMRAAIDLKPVDRVPNAPFYEAPLMSYFAPTMRAGLMDPEAMVAAHLKAVEEFKFDWAIFGMNLIGGMIPEALGCKVSYPEDSLPMILETPIKSLADVAGVAKADIFNRDTENLLKGVAELHRRLDGQVPLAVEFISPFTIATRLRGTNEIMADFYKNPELIESLQEVLVPKVIELGQAFYEAGVEYFFYGADMECPLLISADHYRKVVHPPTIKAVNGLAALGGKVLPHMCGPIVKTGIVDSLMEMDIKGIMPGNLTQAVVFDINELKDKVGDSLAIFGNINPNGPLLIGTPEEVEAETKAHLEKTRGMKGYIFSTSGTSAATTPRANYEAMNRAVLEFDING